MLAHGGFCRFRVAVNTLQALSFSFISSTLLVARWLDPPTEQGVARLTSGFHARKRNEVGPKKLKKSRPRKLP